MPEGRVLFKVSMPLCLHAHRSLACKQRGSGAGAIPWFLAGELVPVEVENLILIHQTRAVHNVL